MTKLTPLAKLTIKSIEDLKGLDIKVLDVKKLTALTDWMIICTGTSNRHVKSLADNVMKMAKEKGYSTRSVQGMDQGEWVLVDMVEVVVHAMLVGARAHYQLEKLWDLQPEDDAPEPAKKPRSVRKVPAAAAGKAAAKKPVTKAAMSKTPTKSASKTVKAPAKKSTKPAAKLAAKSAAKTKTAAKSKTVAAKKKPVKKAAK